MRQYGHQWPRWKAITTGPRIGEVGQADELPVLVGQHELRHRLAGPRSLFRLRRRHTGAQSSARRYRQTRQSSARTSSAKACSRPASGASRLRQRSVVSSRISAIDGSAILGSEILSARPGFIFVQTRSPEICQGNTFQAADVVERSSIVFHVHAAAKVRIHLSPDDDAVAVQHKCCRDRHEPRSIALVALDVEAELLIERPRPRRRATSRRQPTAHIRCRCRTARSACRWSACEPCAYTRRAPA